MCVQGSFLFLLPSISFFFSSTCICVLFYLHKMYTQSINDHFNHGNRKSVWKKKKEEEEVGMETKSKEKSGRKEVSKHRLNFLLLVQQKEADWCITASVKGFPSEFKRESQWSQIQWIHHEMLRKRSGPEQIKWIREERNNSVKSKTTAELKWGRKLQRCGSRYEIKGVPGSQDKSH